MPEEVLKIAHEFIRAGFAGDVKERLQETLHAPLVVYMPTGEQHSWFLPLSVEDRLVGYLQISKKLEFIRHVTFRKKPGSLEGTPRIVDWLDPMLVKRRAAAIARPDETLSIPVLTYDQYPDRLAWRVDARSSKGKTRRIMVAGESAYEQVDLKDSIG